MKKIYLLVLFSILLLNSCSECPITEAPPIFVCETRIVTMEKFNPNFTIVSDKAVLDSDYNISIYQFPDNSSSSGSFPNDSRFEGNAVVALASFPFAFNDSIYYANIMDSYPTNEQLMGDFLVQDVNVTSNPPIANIRIFGSIALFSQGLFTEDSQKFCDFVEQNNKQIQNSFKNFTEENRFGKNQVGIIQNTYTVNNIIITDNNGKIVGTAGTPSVPTPPQDVINKLNDAANKLVSFDLPVIPGNVYTYIAKNGKRFVIVITEIRQTNITPFRKRVSMMLYPLDK